MPEIKAHNHKLVQTHLEKDHVKNSIEEKIINEIQKETKDECIQTYMEVLEKLTPAQIADLITKNYTKNGEFLAYKDIPKDYSYNLLVQTSLVMLGYEMPIDAHYGNKTRAAVRLFQKDNTLVVDGSAGPKVLKTITTLLAGKTAVDKRPAIVKKLIPKKIEPIKSVENQDAKIIKLDTYIQHVKKARKITPPVNATMLFTAAKKINNSVITPEVVTAIAQYETGLGTHCLEKRTPGKSGRFTYYNIGNIQGTNPQSREEGANAIADHLQYRYEEFKNVYPKTKPTISQLLTNQGPDNKGFISKQANYKKNNPNAMGAYCADSSSGEKVGDQVYPHTISKIVRKINSLAA